MYRTGAVVLRGAALRRTRFFAASIHQNFATFPQKNQSILMMKSMESAMGAGNQKRFYSNKDHEDPIAVDDSLELYKDLGGMSPIQVPADMPNVPILAINRYPLFPGFIKKVDIVKDDNLKAIIRRQLSLKQPYAGVFVKRDDENKEETITSLSEVYPTGSFVQIIEVRDQGSVLELVLSAHRRIRVLEPIEEPIAPKTDTPLNGRRARGKRGVAPLTPPPSPPLSTPTSAPEASSSSEEKLKKKGRLLERNREKEFSKNNETKATMMAIVQTIRDVVQFNQLFGQQINLLLHPSQNVIDNPVYLCDLVATLVQSAETKDLQEMMDETDVSKRLKIALLLIQKEKAVAKLKHDINKDVEKKVQDHHRKYLLNEQLKVIKKELGIEKDEKTTIIEKIDERIKTLAVPEYALKVINEEKTKLQFLDPHSSEFSVTRNYLEWLTSVPWGLTSPENRRLSHAKKALDEGHYGMKDVKERIMEFIAVNLLRKSIGGKILCFHGPPGVGKTSIAKSIANALNREYFRFSVGGMTDVAEIKGHRRTYVGAMPGKMIQCMKKVKTENPLVLIDEVDKIGGAGFHGDPASALLELLDPEQNANFNDHFLDVPVDLSRVLFICTANEISKIPGPLRDRMEMIDVSGYLAEEKVAIAHQHLIPQLRKETSLSSEQLNIEDSALEELIKHYCRESGVRNLQQHIERIFRKAALQIAEQQTEEEEEKPMPTTAISDNSDAEPITSTPSSTHKTADQITINTENLQKFVGRPKFTSDRMYETTPPGVIMGLAWTAMGGSALYIETVLKRPVDLTSDKDGSIETTGNLGDVMKESVRTALTVAKGILAREQPDNKFFDKAQIHIHVPEGATPKDGPSAGVTLVSSLLSLALNRSVVQDMAMTGEISLTGKVLPVGGIREKIIAARRVGAKRVFLPAENRRDFDDLPEFMKSELDIRFVSHYDELYEHLFQ
uniref:Lon protease homolog, mitochondrial n=1 Tax=Caenorhabditis tropicalis TaxID=1561998 RepID=A0A1I7UG91_9PELO